MPDAPYKCLFCRAPVHGSEDGVAFGAMGKFLFVTCHTHAPLARMAGKTVGQVAIASASAFVERKLPFVAHVFKELRDARKKELEAS